MIKEKDVWKEGKRETYGEIGKSLEGGRGIEHGQINILDFYSFLFFYLIIM
jgi:hypothetical protein